MLSEKVENELNIAAQIQKSILPSDFPAFPEHNQFDLYAMMTPAREVGGEFYDFFFIDDEHLAVIINLLHGIPTSEFRHLTPDLCLLSSVFCPLSSDL